MGLFLLAFQAPSMQSEQLQVSSEREQTSEDDRETLSAWHHYFFEMNRTKPKPIKQWNLLRKKQGTTSNSEEPTKSGKKFDLDDPRFRCIESHAWVLITTDFEHKLQEIKDNFELLFQRQLEL